MKGKITLILTPEQLASAVTYWLNERVLKEDVVEVTYINKTSDVTGYRFEVEAVTATYHNEKLIEE